MVVPEIGGTNTPTSTCIPPGRTSPVSGSEIYAIQCLLIPGGRSNSAEQKESGEVISHTPANQVP